MSAYYVIDDPEYPRGSVGLTVHVATGWPHLALEAVARGLRVELRPLAELDPETRAELYLPRERALLRGWLQRKAPAEPLPVYALPGC